MLRQILKKRDIFGPYWGSLAPARPSLEGVGWTVAVAAGYVVLAWLSYRLGTIRGNVSPIWPAAGLSVAVLARRPRLWPAPILGDFVSAVLAGTPVPIAAFVGLGGGAEAVVAAAMLRRMVGTPVRLDRLRAVVAFDVAAATTPLLSVSVGLAAFVIAGIVSVAQLPQATLIWWIGDGLGILVVAPVLLALPSRLAGPWRLSWRTVEAALLGGIGLAVGIVTFGGGPLGSDVAGPRAYGVFPVLAYVAVRFGPAGAAWLIALDAALAVGNMAAGQGPFLFASPVMATTTLALFIGALTLTGLGLAAVVLERRSAELQARQDLEDRRRAESNLLRTELTFRAVLEQSPNAIVAIDDGGLLVYVNPSAAQTFGYSTAELNGMSVDLLVPDGFRENHERLRAAYVAGPRPRPLGIGVDLLGRRRDGSTFPVEISLTPIDTPAGRRFFATIVDTSERTRLELELRQALKLESIGRLAGGIAHDFNNLLTAIRGYAELAHAALPAGDPAADDVDQVLLAADRAAALTHQLLAFSRRQVLQPQVLDVGEAVERLTPMLQRLLGEHIVLEADGTRGLGHVRVDPGQLEQIIVNLAVNARDAMPQGGQLTMEAADVELGPEYAAAHPEVMPGRYVLLAVSDTGSGMDAETQARAFEPFYTTKEPGRGTGMGLATVYGIVKQSGGYIYVSSEPGRGTTFRIYFPRVDEPLTADDLPSEMPTRSGTETILLAEDNPAVRDFARRALSAHGYTVVEAANGAEALALAAQPGARMDLLMTDVAMPSMNGPELAARLRSERPGLPVLYVSGFAENYFGRSDLPAEGVAFLPKPFNAGTVARVVRELLDASR
ncbi:MAG: MASE1 domain-containing protein [Candidatus Limnocylindrales bacterium]|jgi:PAS domain S-box-containing protein